MTKRCVAYVFRTAGFGGAELNFATLLQHLDRGRFEPVVYLYCTNQPTDQRMRAELARLRIPVHAMDQDGVPCAAEIDAPQGQAAISPSAPKHRHAAKAALLKLVPSSAKLAWHYRGRIREATQRLREARLDIIHFLHGGYPSFSIPMIASRRAGIPVRIADVLLEPRSVRSRDIGFVRGLFAWRAGRCMTRVRAMSQRMKRQLVRLWGVPHRRIVVVSNWVDMERFPAFDGAAGVRGELGVPADALLISVVARLSAEKGHGVLLDAAMRLRLRYPQLRYLLLGDGPLRQELEAGVAERGLQQQVRFLGFREDIPRLLAASDMAVLPSFAEGVPASVLEAMAAGLPVIATDVGGVREVLVDGSMGRLIAPGSVEQLVEALEQLLAAGSAQRRAMGRRARDHVRAHFTLERIVGCLFDLYREPQVVAR